MSSITALPQVGLSSWAVINPYVGIILSGMTRRMRKIGQNQDWDTYVTSLWPGMVYAKTTLQTERLSSGELWFGPPIKRSNPTSSPITTPPKTASPVRISKQAKRQPLGEIAKENRMDHAKIGKGSPSRRVKGIEVIQRDDDESSEDGEVVIVGVNLMYCPSGLAECLQMSRRKRTGVTAKPSLMKDVSL
jgi:hypothetical protein